MADARVVLGQKARTMDTRQKLEKIRNLKDGNLEVKIELSTKVKPVGEVRGSAVRAVQQCSAVQW